LTVAAFSPGQRSLERADGGGDVSLLDLDLGHALMQLSQGLAAREHGLAAPGGEVNCLGFQQTQADLEIPLPPMERRRGGCRFGHG
jgi:hypothetical protein